MDRIAALEFLLSKRKPIDWGEYNWKPGTLWSWGDNTYGELGRAVNTANPATRPGQVGTASDWQQVSCGVLHTLAIKQNGTLWSWGFNSYGQLGLGGKTNVSAPTQIGIASDWRQVSCGAYHTLAIKQDGTLWSWGRNGDGQLSFPGLMGISQLIPKQIGIASDWRQVSCGAYHTLAIKQDGTLWSWGRNGEGQLGLGDNTLRSFHTQVGIASDWQRVDCGRSHTLAIKQDGTLWSWGRNFSGQLGLGHTTNVSAPTQIGENSDWQQISCGGTHTLAIKQDGTLWSWGRNGDGELGLGYSGWGNYQSIPTQVGTASDWQQVAGEFHYSLAIKQDGTLWSWGSNFSGQLGLGHTTNVSAPTQIGENSDWQQISCGGTHTLAIKLPT